MASKVSNFEKYKNTRKSQKLKQHLRDRGDLIEKLKADNRVLKVSNSTLQECLDDLTDFNDELAHEIKGCKLRLSQYYKSNKRLNEEIEQCEEEIKALKKELGKSDKEKTWFKFW